MGSMRHEWKPRSSDTPRRASDEDSDLPMFWIQTLNGEWRALGIGDGQDVREMLRLAEREKTLAEEVDDQASTIRNLVEDKLALEERVRELEGIGGQLGDAVQELDGIHMKRITELETEVERLRTINREMAATCTHPDMLATQEGPLDV